jgi:hypothetical protein
MGIELNENTNLYTLHFGDDQVTCVNDKDDLEYLARQLKEEYESCGLTMNVQKKKTMCGSRN